MTLGERIRGIRERLQMDRLEFAVKLRAAGVRCVEHSLWRWESDTNRPEVPVLVAIARLGKMSVDDLVRGTALDPVPVTEETGDAVSVATSGETGS